MAQATGLRARIHDAAGGFAGRGRTVVVTGTALAVLVAGGVVWSAVADPGGEKVTAYFHSGVGVYEGSELKVLGVSVGSVESVQPQGRRVKVTLRLDEGVKVPADAQAVVISPSLVSGRYVQLTPAYESGPVLGDGDEIPVERTATPVEVDEIYEQITRFSDALGPEGANAKGALSDLIDTGAANLDGNGKELSDSIEQFGDATATLAGRSGDLFGTLKNLQSFTTMLKDNDTQVRDVEGRLSDVTTFLAEDRDELAQALRQLGSALGHVQKFVKDNRGRIKGNVDKLAELTDVIVANRASLAEAMDAIPLAADNVLRAYDPESRTIDGRGNLNEISMGGPLLEDDSPTAGLVAVPEKRLGALPELPLPTVGQVYGTPEKAAPQQDASPQDAEKNQTGADG
ncbi:MCE family protein [Streptomyces polyrhachis]|uniref:MCE family protein n=1 Tax=Streptomyces polyrhachis TaxID=1282885 RepID=A0ABW2GEI2_9ACTN